MNPRSMLVALVVGAAKTGPGQPAEGVRLSKVAGASTGRARS
jgi:hypothetical protein